MGLNTNEEEVNVIFVKAINYEVLTQEVSYFTQGMNTSEEYYVIT